MPTTFYGTRFTGNPGAALDAEKRFRAAHRFAMVYRNECIIASASSMSNFIEVSRKACNRSPERIFHTERLADCMELLLEAHPDLHPIQL